MNNVLPARKGSNPAQVTAIVRVTLAGAVKPVAGAFEQLIAAAPETGPASPAALMLEARDSLFPVMTRWLTHGDTISDWDIAALSDPEGALLIGFDRSADRALLQALVDSRALYRDIVACLPGIALETDAEGRFTYLSAPRVLGHDSEALIGMPVERFLLPAQANPFMARHRQKISDLKLWTARGEVEHWSLTVNPVYSEDGLWRGMRGFAEDVTLVRSRERSLRQSEAREALLARFVLLIRDAVSSKALLEAAMSIIETFSATDAWILKHEDRQFVTQLHRGEGEEMPPLEVISALVPLSRTGEAIHHLDSDGMDFLVCVLQHKIQVIGALIVRRDTSVMPWRESDLILARRLADHLSIALQDAQNLERLEIMAHVDELTGLLNRRAFDRAVGEALSQGASGSLLYIDLDYFKQVNDTLGHAAGDAVLSALGAIMKTTMRGSDIAGRRGGDEFVVWLPSATRTVARRVAGMLVSLAPELREAAGDPTLLLGLSIGIAHVEPGMSYDELTETADAALYNAKESGRGRYVEGN